jgi:uncharacterized protein DUF6603
MDARDTLSALARQIALAFQPLADAFSSAGALRDFLEEFGWDFTAVPPPLDAVRAPVQDLYALADRPEGLNEGDVAQVVLKLRAAFQAITELESAAGLAADFRDEFPRQLIDYLLVEYLLINQRRWGYLLMALGIVTLEERAAVAPRLAYLRRRFEWDQLSQLLQDPLPALRSAYRWGQGDFDGDRLIQSVSGILDGCGLDVRDGLLTETAASALNQDALQPDALTDLVLRLVLLESANDPAQLTAGAGLFILPETASAKPGFALLPFATAGLDEEFGLSDQLSLTVHGELDLTGGAGVLVRPNQDVGFLLGFESGAPAPATGDLAVVLRFTNAGEPITLIGDPAASRFEVVGLSTTAGTRLGANAKLEAFAEFGLEGGKIVIKPSPDDVDGFLAKLLPADGMTLEADLTIGTSSDRGIYFSGSGGLEVSLPLHIQLGPIEIQSALVAIKPADGKIPLDLAASVKAGLGPLTAVVQNVGIKAIFSFPPKRDGNLGPVQFDLGFRAPDGIGLSIDAGVVKGGGFLSIDAERGEYAGAIELTFQDIIALKAVGLITTRMPDGSKGFSLLVIITAEFGSGIQLGFGFTLLGVGGILGLNRVVAIEALSSGIRSGGIESVMFPKDVVANAPRIISDLRQYFPPQRDVFLVGPMAKLRWGTPTLVSGQLGVILEFPSVNITILGVLKVVLPHEDADILHLQVNFIGRLEPANSRMWFYAELYDSRLLFLTLEGGFGMLLDWGDDPNFVLSAGGFHPRFTPPPLPFPEPPRIAVSILNESLARIRIEGYFAVTSNSVQFGSRAEMFFGVSDFGIDGHLTFDALFQFDPFYFRFALSTSFSVKVFGVGVYSVGYSGLLEGPTPWHIEGKGHISLLFFSISVPFQHTWGSNQDTRLDPIEVMQLADAEFKALSNWEAKIPVASNLNVSLRKLDETETDRLVLHPLGKLRISERKVPINFKLDKVGNKKPKDVNRLKVSATLSGSTGLSIDTVKDRFAIGQFRDLDASAQLSSPAFEPLDSGIEIGVAGAALKTSRAVRRVIRYETIIIDNNFKRHVKRFFGFLSVGYAALNELLFIHFLAGSAVTKSPQSQHQKKRLQPFDEVITIEPNLYSIVSSTDNQPTSSAMTTFSSQAEAEQHLEDQVRSSATKAGILHVVPNSELRMAA